jgi:hypothetical protein
MLYQEAARSPGRVLSCEHGDACHDGTESSAGTAPERARSWLLIEYDGAWPADETEAALPGPLGKLAAGATELGIRVQLIRRPGRRPGPAVDLTGQPAVFAGWAAGPAPWLRRGTTGEAADLDEQLAAVADGEPPSFGIPHPDPLYLVCAHGKRDVCCARLGGPLARALAADHPNEVWETTHVSGHRYAANLVILPHALYYGPVGPGSAKAAVDAYQRGEIAPARFRGRAGQPFDEQLTRHRAMTATGTYALTALD